MTDSSAIHGAMCVAALNKETEVSLRHSMNY
jgi:hypothetical protein